MAAGVRTERPVSRILVGYFIRRTWKKPPHDGQTLFAESHRVYPTRELAHEVMENRRKRNDFDPRFEYDVAEAWMHTEDEQ